MRKLIRILGGGVKHITVLIHRVWLNSMSSDEYVSYLRKHCVKVGENVLFRFPSHTLIDITRPCLVELGSNLDVNDNFTIMTHDFSTFVFRGYFNDYVNCSGKVTIGNNIYFGRNVTVLKGVCIGDNCIIGAGSIITKSIPPNSVVVGVPARVICSLEEYYDKRKARQVAEALEYGRELAVARGGFEKLKMSDFTEEWVLFLSEEEYFQSPIMQEVVKFRLKNKVDIVSFLNRSRPYANYQEFLEAIKNHSD